MWPLPTGKAWEQQGGRLAHRRGSDNGAKLGATQGLRRKPTEAHPIMDAQFHHLNELFLQLGLPDDPAAMDQFVLSQGPLPLGTRWLRNVYGSRSRLVFSIRHASGV